MPGRGFSFIPLAGPGRSCVPLNDCLPFPDGTFLAGDGGFRFDGALYYSRTCRALAHTANQPEAWSGVFAGVADSTAGADGFLVWSIHPGDGLQVADDTANVSTASATTHRSSGPIPSSSARPLGTPTIVAEPPVPIVGDPVAQYIRVNVFANDPPAHRHAAVELNRNAGLD